MVSVEDSKLRGGGRGLKQHIWNAARDTIQEWTGEELTECSLYGIRVYTEGSILAPHVDRLPLVSSAIINVAQDLDEPWYVVPDASLRCRLRLFQGPTSPVVIVLGLWKFLATTAEHITLRWNRVTWCCTRVTQ